MNDMKQIHFLLFGILYTSSCFLTLSAQEKSKEQLKTEKEAETYLAEGSDALSADNFTDAEVNYRKSIALNPSVEVGKYNLGNAYYNKAQNEEAMLRYKQAASVATTKPEKHKAYHNLGNSFMNAKMYQEAVEAYKNALRNNPNDDETRYNLALAKEMLEKNPPQGGGDDDKNKDNKENQDQNKDQQNQDNQNNKDQNNDNKQDQDNKDQGDQKDKKDGDQEGDNEKQKEPQKDQQGDGDQPKDQKQQPVPGQMSPQQIKNLLEAMNNEEKKVQDKINLQKQKGAKVKPDKDW